MTTTPTAPTDYRPEEIDEASFVRYLLASLGAAGLGLGAALVLRRPHRMVLGGGMIAGGAALLARGVRGQWPRLPGGLRRAIASVRSLASSMTSSSTSSASSSSRSSSAASEPSPIDQGWGENQGEGNRTAARHYNDEVREFIDDGRVAPAARSAAVAVDGPEGAALRAAEARGKTSPTNGRH